MNNRGNWKMRCTSVWGADESRFTAGKVYQVENCCFKDDSGWAISGAESLFNDFNQWVNRGRCRKSGVGTESEWELVVEYTPSEAKEIIGKYLDFLQDSGHEIVSSNLAELVKKMEEYTKKYGKPKVDWSKIPVGTKVLCWDNECGGFDKFKMVFMGELNGKIWVKDESVNNNILISYDNTELALEGKA